MFRIYQPHIYTGKGMDRGHIKPGDTVYPWGGASDLARIGLVSAAQQGDMSKLQYAIDHATGKLDWHD